MLPTSYYKLRMTYVVLALSVHIECVYVCINLTCYVYILTDPNFTVSSEQDHAKQAFKAHTNIDRIVSCTSAQRVSAMIQ